MTLLERAQHLQDLAASRGTIFDAIETYYADDVEIVEATGETFRGKDTQAQRVREFFESVTGVHGSGVSAIAATETGPGTGVALVETWSDFDFAQGGRFKMEEVAVQTWEDGKVVRERFYYTPPPSGDA